MTTFHETIAEDLGNALTILKLVRDGDLGLDALEDVQKRIRAALKKASAVKLFVDDERLLPSNFADAGFKLVRSAEVAIEIIKYVGLENVTHISLDHDLGLDVMSGYDVAKYVEERVMVHGDPMPEMSVHSNNPPGSKNIRMAIQAMRRHLGIAD